MRSIRFRRCLALLAISAFSLPVFGQSTPFLNDEQIRMLRNEISGDRAFEHIRVLTQWHRDSGMEGYFKAMNYVVEKKGDTHAIAIFTGVWLTNPLTQTEAKVTVKDMTPVVRLVLEPAVIAVKNDAPYKSLKDFIDAAKKSPGREKK